jgi:formate hydrogenlyase subunit 4
MSIVLPLLAQILHIALMVIAAPALAGVMDWLDARLAGRFGPPLLLPWHDLLRLSRKTPMTTENGSVVSHLAPALGLGATLSAAALVPSFTLGMTLSPLADVLVIASLLTVARVTSILAALDSGAALPGLSAQRSSAMAVLTEPALMLSVVALALMAGSFNLDLIIGQQHEGLLLPVAASSVILTALVALVFADASTADRGAGPMFSGTDLLMTRMTGWLRPLIWVGLIGGLFLPVGMATAEAGPIGWLIGLASWACKLGLFALCLSGVQALVGRIPRRSLPDLIGVAALLALLAIIIVLTSAGLA